MKSTIAIQLGGALHHTVFYFFLKKNQLNVAQYVIYKTTRHIEKRENDI